MTPERGVADTSMAASASGIATNGPAMLLRQAERLGDRVALRHKDLGIWRESSWRSYAQWVARQARAFEALGVTAGDRVAILAKGELDRPLTVKAHRVSEAAQAKIVAAGGTVEIIED